MELYQFGFTLFINVAQIVLIVYFFGHLTDGHASRQNNTILTAVMLVAMCIFWYVNFPWYYIGIITLLLMLGRVLFNSGWFLCALSAILTAVIMSSAVGTVNSLLSALSPYLFKIFNAYTGKCIMVMGGLLSIGVAYLCYTVILKKFTPMEGTENLYMLMMLAPLLLILLSEQYITDFIYGNTITLSQDGRLLGIPHIQVLIIQILSLLSIFSVIYACHKLQEGFQQKAKAAALSQQADMQKKYVEEAKLRYEQTRSFRHDIKNHLTILRGLCETDNTEEAGAYLRGLDGITESLSFVCHTNNAVLDVLLGSKLTLAKEHRIQTECSFEVPSYCCVEDIDLCIIFANALDNAVNACCRMEEDRRCIRIHGEVQGNFLMTEIENSCPDCEKAVSCCGTGISNIRAAAEKYDGAVNIDCTDGHFRLQVLLVIA